MRWRHGKSSVIFLLVQNNLALVDIVESLKKGLQIGKVESIVFL